MKTTTIFEISKLLNLSPSTVSRALKDHPDIATETKKRVLEMAQKMDYEPNVFAVGLRKNKSKEIGIIVPNLSGFFYDAFIASVEEEAKKIGYSLVILLSGDDSDVELANLKTCKQRRVDGIMICLTANSQNQEYFEKLQSQEIPLVFFDKVPELPNSNTVCVADEASAAIAAHTLIARNKHSTLSIFGDLGFSITRKRLDAYKKVFANYAPAAQATIVHAASTDQATQAVMEAWQYKSHSFDAIFCMSDEILIGAMKAVQKLGTMNKIGVIAISNGFFPRLYHPEITYVETSAYKLGKLAFQRAVNLIEGPYNTQQLIVDSALVEGGSL